MCIKLNLRPKFHSTLLQHDLTHFVRFDPTTAFCEISKISTMKIWLVVACLATTVSSVLSPGLSLGGDDKSTNY